MGDPEEAGVGNSTGLTDAGPSGTEPASTAPARPLTAWQKIVLIVKVVEIRLRFIAILVAVGLFIGYWDTVKNYWDKWTRPQSVAARQLAPDQEFFCPMHPQVVRSTYEPNGDVPSCPICGMPLSIRKKGEKEALPEGITGRVQFTPERIQEAGIKTVPVSYRPMAKVTTTVGYVTYDESRLSKVVSRVAGYVEKLYVDKTYVTVCKDQVLAEIYSPELYSTAQELLIDMRSPATRDLVASTKERLLLYGVSPEEIDQIARTGKAGARLKIRSPQHGYVISKRIVEGSSVTVGMTLLEVADLSTVWVEADVFEKDVGLLRPGQAVEATVDAYPGRVFRGRLDLVYPLMETATRTNRARFVLPNPNDELRPGMFATLRIKTPLDTIEPFRTLAANRRRIIPVAATHNILRDPPGEAPAADDPPGEVLAVPERAIVDTGAKQVVYVETEPGVFEGREVQLGPRVGGYYPVVKGLEPGDRVAAAGAFLIDAETRLNPAAASSYFGASGSQSNRGSSGGSARRARERPLKVEEPTGESLQNINALPEGDRPLALQQKMCPITGAVLGAMGVPLKITLRGQPVFLCCPGCRGKAKRNPEETLKKVERFKHQTAR